MIQVHALLSSSSEIRLFKAKLTTKSDQMTIHNVNLSDSRVGYPGI